MITFRYHIVSLVSVFLALAIGVALGGGPLKGEVDNSLVKELAEKKKSESRLRGDLKDSRARITYTDRVLQSAGPALLGGALRRTTVAVVALPGAEQSSLTRVTESLDTAGARLGGSYRIGAPLADPDERQLITQLSTELADGIAGVDLPENGGAYERMGALIGRGIATQQPAGTRLDRGARSIQSGLATAGILSADGDPVARAGAVVIVAGSPTGESEDTADLYRRVAQGLAGDSAGVVVAGPSGSAQGDGVLLAIRSDVATAADVATVDSVNSPVGGLVTALVVERALAGDPGHYGAIGASDGAVPEPGDGQNE